MTLFRAEYVSTLHPYRTVRVETEASSELRAINIFTNRYSDIKPGTLRVIKEPTMMNADKNETLFNQLQEILALPGARLTTHDQVFERVRKLVSLEQGARKCMPLNTPDQLAGNFSGCFAEAVRIAAHEAIQRSPLNAEVTALKAELAEAMKKQASTKSPSAGAIKERKKKVESVFRELFVRSMPLHPKPTDVQLQTCYAQAKIIVEFLESQP